MAPPRSEPTRSVRLIGVLTGAGDVAGTAARFRSQALTPRRPRAAPARVLRELSILCIAFFVLSIRCARDGGGWLLEELSSDLVASRRNVAEDAQQAGIL